MKNKSKVQKWLFAWLTISVFSLVAIESWSESKAPQVSPKVIYGEDNRIDIYQETNSRNLELARSTAALIQTDKVILNQQTLTAKIESPPFGNQFGLCEDEPFFEQPSGAFCSGSLIGDDLLMTAGHCIENFKDCESTFFAFGYSVEQEGVYPYELPVSQIYSCKELIVTRRNPKTGADFAVIKLDRKVENGLPLLLNREKPVEEGTELLVIGHPSGLPTKIAAGATVRSTDPEGYFTANLDTYGGNSGSAVFNAKTGLIEGILVRGETDFRTVQGCRRSNVCPEDGCRGEDVTKISEVIRVIDRL